jgi:hypothetical protein
VLSYKVDDVAIEAIRLKLERAQEHLRTMTLAMDDYVKRRPRSYGIESVDRSPTTSFRYVLRLAEPVPPMLSVILGEAIHDMRSALDQCVFQLYAANNGGKERSGTAFPIVTEPQEYQKHRRDDIRGLGAGVKDFIEKLQPYPDRTLPVHDSLCSLNALWNRDKHRMVHIWGIRMDTSELVANAGAKVVHTHDGRVLHDGDEAFRMVALTRPPHQQLRLTGRVGVNPTFEHISPRGKPVPMSLFDLHADTLAIVEALLSALPNQDEPVEVEWPKHGETVPADLPPPDGWEMPG